METTNAIGTKLCGRCLITKRLSDFYKNSGRLRSYCKLCSDRRSAEYRNKNPDVIRKISLQPSSKFSAYKNNARIRGHEFLLSFDEFMMFWQKPCHYCHDAIDTIGLDRIDNTIGYRLGNINTCCPTCNWMKGEQNVDDFINRCWRIYSVSMGSM